MSERVLILALTLSNSPLPAAPFPYCLLLPRRTTLLRLFSSAPQQSQPTAVCTENPALTFQPHRQMPKRNTLKSLGSLFCSSIKSTPATTTTSAAAAETSPAVDKNVWSAKLLRAKLDTGERKMKQKFVFKKGQADHVNRLVHSWAVRLGTDATLNLFGKLGHQTSMKHFNTLLKICIENASTTDDETVALEQVTVAFKVFMSMKEQGFPIEEESYGQVLLYLIDKGMVEQFHLFSDIIKDASASQFHCFSDVSASTLARLGYYEELLYTRVNDEEKVEEFCNCNFTSDGDETISLRDVVSRAVVDGGDS